MLIEYALLGALGGLARSCVGLLKALRNNVEIDWAHTTVTIIASAIIGSTAGLIFNSDYKISLIAGYIGTDLLENIAKIFLKKNQL
jgi:fluoride ion exporter CrcB/FEX